MGLRRERKPFGLGVIASVIRLIIRNARARRRQQQPHDMPMARLPSKPAIGIPPPLGRMPLAVARVKGIFRAFPLLADVGGVEDQHVPTGGVADSVQQAVAESLAKITRPMV